MSKRLVILGNGGAAISAAKSARFSGYQGEICMVSDSVDEAFNPMLALYYLKGYIPWERCFPFGLGVYREFDITCHFGAPVESLDAVNQEVIVAGGRRLAYDRCLIATGASPVIPSIPGLKNSSRAFVVRTPASVRSLEKTISSSRRAVVLGASFVGLKAAEILARRHIEVILLDVVDQVLPRGAHPVVAALLKVYFEDHGVDVRLGCTMEGMEGAREGVVCQFSDKVIEEADFVVVCSGVRPNIGFIETGQVDIDQAILVDERMGTRAPNLYAAGDVCQGMNTLSGRTECFGTWRSACLQGRTAGHSMAGRETAYSGSIQENISPFFEWIYAQIGDVHREGRHIRHVVLSDPEEEGHALLVFDEDVLIGVNLINCTRFAGILRGSVVRRSHWDGLPALPAEDLTFTDFEILLGQFAPYTTQAGAGRGVSSGRRLW
jgi:NADPH-dependent 2,4-dienoyl-CoA reductase/sulfur reductase-like enzyme